MTLELVAFGLVVIAITACSVLGAMAFFRMGRYRQALLEAEERIRSLESTGAIPPRAEKVEPRAAPTPPPAPLVRPAALRNPVPPPQVAPPTPTPQPEPTPVAAPIALTPRVDEPLAPRPAPAPTPPLAPPAPAAPPEPVVLQAAPEPQIAVAIAAAEGEEERAPSPSKVALAQLAPWGAGGLLAALIVLFLHYAYQHGFFDRASLLTLGWLLGAGLVGGAEILRRKRPADVQGDWQLQHGPTIAAGAGMICLYGMAWVGFAMLGLLSQTVCIALLGVFSLLALALSLNHGPALGGLGLAGGYAAPILVGVHGAPPPALFSYLFAITAAGFSLAERRHWRWLAAAAAAAALLWAGFWTVRLFLPAGAIAASVYLTLLGGLGVAFAAPDMREASGSLREWTARAWIGASAAVAAAGALILLFFIGKGAAYSAVLALAALTLVLSLATASRQGFAAALAPIGALGLVAVAMWPPFLDALDAQRFATAAGAFGFAASVGGWIMIGRSRALPLGAVLAGLAPAAALAIAQLRLGATLGEPIYWSAAAVSFALLNAAALYRLARLPETPGKAGAINVFAAAAAGCGVLAGAFSVDPVLLGGAVALLLPALALLDQKLSLIGLRVVAVIAAALSATLLSPPALFFADVSPAPLLNSMTLAYAVAIACFLAAWRLFAAGPSGKDGQASIAARVGLVLVFVFAGWAQIRHLVNADMNAAYRSLWEAGGHSLFLAALAIAATPRGAAETGPLRARTELLALAAALAHAVAVAMVWLNPWWGLAPAEASQASLAAAYLLPGLALLAYGVLKRADGAGVARRAALAGAFTMIVAWAILAVREMFHPGPALASAPIAPLEHASYSLVLLAAASALWAIGRWRALVQLHYLSAALALCGFGKALLVDAMTLDGLLLKIAACALITATAAGVGFAYARFVFPSVGERLFQLSRWRPAFASSRAQP